MADWLRDCCRYWFGSCSIAASDGAMGGWTGFCGGRVGAGGVVLVAGSGLSGCKTAGAGDVDAMGGCGVGTGFWIGAGAGESSAAAAGSGTGSTVGVMAAASIMRVASS